MEFTIIGAGNMGKGIATRLLNGGHSVVIIDRDNSEAQKLADSLRPEAKGGATVTAGQPGGPINSPFVVLAVYFHSVQEVVAQYGDRLAGKVLVDISNPLNASFDDLAVPAGTSAAEELAKKAPSAAAVLKAFNTNFSSTLVAGKVAGQPLDVFIAGDDEQAKAKLAQAISDAGMRPIDAGPLRRARQLEAMGLLNITMQGKLGTNYSSAIKVIS